MTFLTFQGIDPDPPESWVAHLAPARDEGRMPCCDLTTAEVSERRDGRSHCLVSDWGSVTCSMKVVDEPARPSTPLGAVVRDISDLIDSTYPPDLDKEAWLWRRCMKTREERGESVEAILGVLGENPRKGQTHTLDDLRKELLDVALAALGAVAHFDDRDPIEGLAEHATFVRDRLAKAVKGDSA